jgi:16S rRNA (uracil1498-N3)-methyltransferase
MPDLPPPFAPIRVATPLAVGQRVRLDADAMAALGYREINVKEAFTLVDASGTFFRASLLGRSAKGGDATVYEQMPASPESPARITLVAAVLGRQRMLMVAQKATELGVVRIAPVFSERSVGPEGLAHEKAHAWPGQTLRAARQCRRASVPEVRTTVPLTRALAEPYWREAAHRYYLDDRAPKKSGAVALPARTPTAGIDVAFAVGPEGGWTDEERALLVAHGAEPMRLGGRVLRAETAVLVGLTVLQHQLGDLAP